VPRVVLFNKPFRVLTRFTDPAGRSTLADFIAMPGVYPAGRLDYDSEGLLVLTDDGRLQHEIAEPRYRAPKVYWAQVDGEPDEHALAGLREGVGLADGWTAPAEVRRLPTPTLWPRDPPIRFRAAIPTTWLEMTLFEGRNRQIRRMTAAVGAPTLRLIRRSIGPWSVEGIEPGAWRVVPAAQWHEAAVRAREGTWGRRAPR